MFEPKGIPGAGKSTIANGMVQEINIQAGMEVAVVLPMDGFHYYKAELDKFPDPAVAHARRGAPFTFNSNALLSVLRQLKDQPLTNADEPAVYAPSFDHAVGDPVEGDIKILPRHKIIIVEGLYLHLSVAPWNQIHALATETWFIDCPLEVAATRLVKRHVRSGICKTAEEARKRVEENDLVNGRYVLEHRLPATREINTGDGSFSMSLNKAPNT